jgi:pilus assembly protein CpaF
MTGATAKAMPNVTSRSIATLGPDQLASLEAQRAMFDAQLRAREHLYSVMDSMLSFIAQDPDLQLMVNEFTLTRDKELDARQRSELQERVTPRLLDARINIPNPRDIETVFDLAYDELIGISVVGDLWRDDDVDEILIDAWDRICVERFGRIEETGRRFRSPDHAMAVSRHLSQMISDRAVSRTNALVTAQLPRARVQFIWGNIAASGLAISIRKFNDLMGMESLLAGASLSEEMRDFLIDAVAARATILVSGGTGTGKTTMINALSEFIPDDERVITIEDAFELRLSNRHVVAMQAKTRTSADDTVTYTQEDLMVASLRMRPDRIIVGEIREPSAAAVMLQAANTGHDGTMTTLHATSASVALNNRMVVLLMRSGTGFSEDTARLEVASAFNLVIQITRSQRTGHRYVSEIALVDTSLLDSSSVRALSLFSGELMVAPDPDDPGTDKTTAYFRQVGRIPRTSALGMKMLDTGNDTSRWLA